MSLIQPIRDAWRRHLSGRCLRKLAAPTAGQVPRRLLSRVVWLLSGLLLVGLTSCGLVAEQLNWVPRPPSAQVERLAQATTMTPLAQRLFYRQEPMIAPPEVFWEQCKVPHGTIVLGCYLGEGRGSKIVIQHVTDQRFAGTMEVTAAHEMLHAAYDRLEPRLRESIFEQLHVVRSQVNNPRLLSLLQDYEAQGRERYGHELYAHLGTELEDFGNPALEAHFQRYFRDRHQVVALAEQSLQVVAKYEQQADVLAVEIGQLEEQLISTYAGLEKAEARLAQLSEGLIQQQEKLRQSWAAMGSAPSQAKAKSLEAQAKARQLALAREARNYNHQVRQLNKSAARFNRMLKDYQQKVEAYNQLVWRRWRKLEGLASQAPTKARRVRQLI